MFYTSFQWRIVAMGTQKLQGHYESHLVSVCVETNCYEDKPENNPTFSTGVVL